MSGALLTEVKNGKIVRDWTYWDQLPLLAQLGITEQPGLFFSLRASRSSDVGPLMVIRDGYARFENSGFRLLDDAIVRTH